MAQLDENKRVYHGDSSAGMLLSNIYDRSPVVVGEGARVTIPEGGYPVFRVAYQWSRGRNLAFVQKGVSDGVNRARWCGEVRQVNPAVMERFRHYCQQSDQWEKSIDREKSRFHNSKFMKAVRFGVGAGVFLANPYLLITALVVKKVIGHGRDIEFNNKIHGMMFYGALAAVSATDGNIRDFNLECARAIASAKDMKLATRAAESLRWTPEASNIWMGVKNDVSAAADSAIAEENPSVANREHLESSIRQASGFDGQSPDVLSRSSDEGQSQGVSI